MQYRPMTTFSRSFLSKKCSNPILILHGMLGSSQNWTQLGKIIHQKTERTVHLLDARNHGKSCHSHEMTYLHMASDLKQFCDNMDISNATFVGHSMGARTAMTFSLLEPKMVEKLVSIDASPIHRTTPQGISQMKIILEAIKNIDTQSIFQSEQNFSATKNKIESELLFHGVAQSSIRQWLLLNLNIDQNHRLDWSFNLDALRSAFERHLTLVPSELSERSFSGDTLFIGGERSDYIPRKSHVEIRKIFPNSKFVYVSKSGHWVHADNPAEFLQVLLSFIDETSS